MSTLFAPVFEPGFFADEAVREAILVGTLVAVVAGAVGFFAVMRSQSFAAEALGDLGTAGSSSASSARAGATWPPGSCWARVSGWRRCCCTWERPRRAPPAQP
jgi:hypothetical protein